MFSTESQGYQSNSHQSPYIEKNNPVKISYLVNQPILGNIHCDRGTYLDLESVYINLQEINFFAPAFNHEDSY